MGPNGETPSYKFRILSVDGGGIRGLISALVIAEIERRLEAKRGGPARMADYFHLFAGTSTGGLISLALTRPDPPPGTDLAAFYTEDGPKIFDSSLGWKVRTGWGKLGPKYPDVPLREAVLRRLGNGRLAEATRDLLLTSYDMTKCEPFLFKRWKALQNQAWNFPVVDAALSTAAAPTYFPAHVLGGRALVDGGVLASNPAVAAISEALGRSSDPPARPALDDMLVVSIGTGEFNLGFAPSEVRGWGELGWIAGGGAEPPILSALLGASADGADYWAHMLLNHEPGEPLPAAQEIGNGPRYFRFQAELEEAIEMDDASQEVLRVKLPAAAGRLIAERDAQIDQIVELLTPIGESSAAPA
jgi:hypothetical protein